MCRYTQNIIIAKPSMDVAAKQQCMAVVLRRQWYNMTAAAVSFGSGRRWYNMTVMVVSSSGGGGTI